ncbi:hypothetical protein J7K50_06190 [bacterium]|nr:hypothetical protein [bacterium]
MAEPVEHGDAMGEIRTAWLDNWKHKREAVYKAAVDLVSTRLDKAKSV